MRRDHMFWSGRLRYHPDLLDPGFFNAIDDLHHDTVRHVAIRPEVQRHIGMRVLQELQLLLKLGHADRIFIEIQALIFFNRHKPFIR